MDKSATLRENLGLRGRWILGGESMVRIRELDKRLAQAGLDAGKRLGSGWQGVIHALGPSEGRLPWHPDPNKHVLKAYSIRPDHPLGLFERGKHFVTEPYRPRLGDGRSMAIPAKRIAIETRPMFGIGHKGKLVGDVMPKANPTGFARLSPSRKVEIGRRLARRMIDRGLIHMDYHPDNIMELRGLMGRKKYRVTDLGGVRKLTPEERKLHKDVLLHKMIEKRDFVNIAGMGRMTGPMDWALRHKPVQTAMVGAALVGVGSAAGLAAASISEDAHRHAGAVIGHIPKTWQTAGNRTGVEAVRQKAAALRGNLGLKGHWLLGNTGRGVSAVDKQLAGHGLEAGRRLGAGMQGVVHELKDAPGRKPWQPDPRKHVLKVVNVRPDHPAGLIPGLKEWVLPAYQPRLLESDVMAVPRKRITAGTPPMFGIGRSSKLIADVMPRANVAAFAKLSPARRIEIGHRLARRLAGHGLYHGDYHPDNIMGFKGMFGRTKYRISDLGGIRPLTESERRLSRNELANRMLEHQDFIQRAHLGRMTGGLDRALRHKPVQTAMAGAALVGVGALLGAGAISASEEARQKAQRAIKHAPRLDAATAAAHQTIVHHFKKENPMNAKAAASDKLPYSVDHPYMHAFGNELAGAGIGGGAGAIAGALTAAIASRSGMHPGAGALVGGVAGAGLGMLGGDIKAVIDHYRDRRRYERETGRELPLVVRHPYLTRGTMAAVTAAPALAMSGMRNPYPAAAAGLAGRAAALAGSTMLHEHVKNEFQKGASLSVREQLVKQAYEEGMAFARWEAQQA
ncbi:MAG: hypothetical protein FJZ00_06240 [Candidatus Sericytochromatia bacterium]|uniref:Protein kinase domain-containing protein n=1 Tax=Candidatus Tanganyikabacteria bacterium TaxID=2961651 RepID=A0A938BKY9_9BACT|nr:hypothetical protein [Candidatus Tanganyikabacteria bacterium]